MEKKPLISKAFRAGWHDRKCLQSLKPKETQQNMLFLTILSTRHFHTVQCLLLKQWEMTFDQRTQLWSFKDGFMSFHQSRLRTTFSYISQQHDFQGCGKYTNIWSWQGSKVLPRGLSGVVMSYSEQQADLNWHHNTETPMSLHWKAWTRAQLQTTFFYSTHKDRASKEIHDGVPHSKKHTYKL